MQFVVTSDTLIMLCSCPSHAIARQLAEQMVAEGWSACVQIVPGITSIYQWQGKVCQESEVLLVIKTATDVITTLTQWLIEAHPYDVPEVITIPISGGSQMYLDWLLSNSAGVKQSG